MERKRYYMIPMTEVVERVACAVLYQTSIDEGDPDEGTPEAREALSEGDGWDVAQKGLWDD